MTFSPQHQPDICCLCSACRVAPRHTPFSTVGPCHRPPQVKAACSVLTVPSSKLAVAQPPRATPDTDPVTPSACTAVKTTTSARQHDGAHLHRGTKRHPGTAPPP
eukprot:56916-Rhodomonas_salina.2